MNKYIKKCLLVYISMAIVLFSMVGVAYAITANDANRYLTRSQYSVEMSYLQQKLDEAEAGLIGNINRYRSTDVKFVTFDTPDYQQLNASQNYGNGYYNGGNFFPRPRTTNISGAQRYYWGRMDAWGNQYHAAHKVLYIFRLYDGNYFVTTPMYVRTSLDSSASASEYYTGVNFAVPVENYPGWYIVFYLEWVLNAYVGYRISITRLDYSVPYSEGPTSTSTLKFRFKKDLFRYCSDNVSRLTTSVQTANVGYSFFSNNAYNNAFTRTSEYGSAPSSTTMTCTGQVDPETGDYLFTLRNTRPDSQTAYYKTHELSSTNFYFTRFIPVDNVEYVCGGYQNREASVSVGHSYNCPHPCPDAVANYYKNYGAEFVDCVNGIKYWHAWEKSAAEGSTRSKPIRWHYSLPIVY